MKNAEWTKILMQTFRIKPIFTIWNLCLIIKLGKTHQEGTKIRAGHQTEGKSKSGIKKGQIY